MNTRSICGMLLYNLRKKSVRRKKTIHAKKKGDDHTCDHKCDFLLEV